MAVTKGRDPISPNTLPHVSKKTVVECVDERRLIHFPFPRTHQIPWWCRALDNRTLGINQNSNYMYAKVDKRSTCSYP